MSGEQHSGSKRANRALDAANFLLADVRDGLGPYLAIYLLTVQKWDEASIGVVMSIATVAGIVAQMPAGALVDAVRAKRIIVAVAALVVTGASLAALAARFLPRRHFPGDGPCCCRRPWAGTCRDHAGHGRA
jgi:MFS family permease